MSKRSPEKNDARQVNENLRGYEGFAAVLALLEQTASNWKAQFKSQLLRTEPVRAAMMQATDEDRAAQQAVIAAIRERPEMADVVKRLQEFEDAERSRIMSVLFPSPGTNSSEQE